MTDLPHKSDDHDPHPHRRTAQGLIALWLLIGIAAVVVWQIARTANEPLPALPTPRPQYQPTATPTLAQLALVRATDTPEDTPRPRPTKTTQPLVNDCASWMKSGDYCTNPYAPLTPTPLLRCDDPRLIGGQNCVWPTPTPAIGRIWD